MLMLRFQYYVQTGRINLHARREPWHRSSTNLNVWYPLVIDKQQGVTKRSGISQVPSDLKGGLLLITCSFLKFLHACELWLV
jgi:hypothetical protein